MYCIFYIPLCLNQLYCGRQQINGFFFPIYFFPQSSVSLHAQIRILSVVSPGADNSEASPLWKHIRLCWIHKNMEEENQQQMQVGKPLLTTEPKLLYKLLFWQCSHFLVFGRSLPFLTVFQRSFYFYLSKPLVLFFIFLISQDWFCFLFFLCGK